MQQEKIETTGITDYVRINLDNEVLEITRSSDNGDALFGISVSGNKTYISEPVARALANNLRAILESRVRNN
jgi:hypothetical protein